MTSVEYLPGTKYSTRQSMSISLIHPKNLQYIIFPIFK